ncbi:MAG: Tm-1-like ATP-binding domain-containing protein [Rhodothermales bacterium]
MRIAVLGTYDSKGDELAFIAEQIAQQGHQPVRIDVGSYGPPTTSVDVTREQVVEAAGVDLTQVWAQQDRGACVAAMARSAEAYLPQLYAAQKIDGLISIGGGGGTSIALAAMRSLPVGVPKLLVSTLAGNPTSPLDLGQRDIVVMPSIVDVAGLNRISRRIFAQAAAAICGMVTAEVDAQADKPLIAASMFGNTTTAVNAARRVLEAAGYEVLVFHATGTGGRTMESLIASGWFAGVLDLTLTEWADELVGGILSAGPTRLHAAADAGVPTVVSTGCLDMVNFGPRETVPAHFADRLLYQHNDAVTLMRTTPEENAQLGQIIAEKLNRYDAAKLSVCLPNGGLSEIGRDGEPFHDAEADAALHGALMAKLNNNITVARSKADINNVAFAEQCAQCLLSLMP